LTGLGGDPPTAPSTPAAASTPPAPWVPGDPTLVKTAGLNVHLKYGLFK